MIIAHDLGTTGNKASLHEPEGRLIEAVAVSYPCILLRGELRRVFSPPELRALLACHFSAKGDFVIT